MLGGEAEAIDLPYRYVIAYAKLHDGEAPTSTFEPTITATSASCTKTLKLHARSLRHEFIGRHFKTRRLDFDATVTQREAAADCFKRQNFARRHMFD
jgi:hypothetical protein